MTTNQKILLALRTFLEKDYYTAKVAYSDSHPKRPWRRLTLSIEPMKGLRALDGLITMSNKAINFLNEHCKSILYKPARRRMEYNIDHRTGKRLPQIAKGVWHSNLIVYWIIKDGWENNIVKEV